MVLSKDHTLKCKYLMVLLILLSDIVHKSFALQRSGSVKYGEVFQQFKIPKRRNEVVEEKSQVGKVTNDPQ